MVLGGLGFWFDWLVVVLIVGWVVFLVGWFVGFLVLIYGGFWVFWGFGF